MALDPREGLFAFEGFKGLRNNVDPSSFDSGDLEVALNVDIDDAEELHRRKGYGAVVVAGIDRALFAAGSVCLGVGSNTLKQILPDLSTVSLRTGLTANLPLSYAAIGARVYYSNGVETGVVENGAHRTWGLTPPILGPATIVGGALPAGRYQYTMTYLRNDGQESGAALAQVVTLTGTSGFTLTLSVSADPTVTYKNVYVTDLNGEKLFLYATVPAADTTFTVNDRRTGSVVLATQFLSPPPAGQRIDYVNGRAIVAVGSRLYPSEPFAPELFDLRKGVPFLDRITLVKALRDGTWIGTDTQVIWLPNAEPEKWEFFLKASYGVIPGTDFIDNTSALGADKGKDPAVFFATAQGLCAGASGGQLVNFTEDRFQFNRQPVGAGVVRRHRGSIQYVVTMQGLETAGNTFV